jgi:hypothetical protein
MSIILRVAFFCQSFANSGFRNKVFTLAFRICQGGGVFGMTVTTFHKQGLDILRPAGGVNFLQSVTSKIFISLELLHSGVLGPADSLQTLWVASLALPEFQYGSPSH